VTKRFDDELSELSVDGLMENHLLELVGGGGDKSSNVAKFRRSFPEKPGGQETSILLVY